MRGEREGEPSGKFIFTTKSWKKGQQQQPKFMRFVPAVELSVGESSLLMRASPRNRIRKHRINDVFRCGSPGKSSRESAGCGNS